MVERKLLKATKALYSNYSRGIAWRSNCDKTCHVVVLQITADRVIRSEL